MDLVSQNLLMTSGGKKDPTYVEDVFSTYLWRGDGNSGRTITNNIDVSGEGGLVWMKSRSTGNVNVLFDTERGANQRLRSDSNLGQNNVDLLQPSFTNSGFTVGSGNEVNGSGNEYTSWTFRKQKGFFDVVTYTGNGTNQNIAHNLGTIPGCIMVKNTSASNDHWAVYHRNLDVGGNDSKAYRLRLDENAARATEMQTWNYTDPTSTHFSVGQSDETNENGSTIVAYLFAGGESTDATARSVAFTSGGSSNQNAQSLTIANSSDTDFGSGDFTMECWFKDTRNSDWSDLDTIFSMSGYTNSSNNDSFSIYQAQGGFVIFNRTGGGFDMVVDSRTNVSEVNQWHHFAWTRSGSGTNNNKIWLDGNLNAQFTRNVTYADGQDFYIGGNQYSGGGTPNEYGFNGKISNVRITKGQAVYTSSFTPSTTPITTTTGGATASNVKVICCNNSSITGSSLTSGTITSTNSPTASTQSPFDDPEGYKFGEEGDQNIIKCGSYVGNSTANHEIYVGWEPQWWLVKNITDVQNWQLLDSMRGWVYNANDQYLVPNDTNADSAFNFGNPTPTGFNLSNASSNWQNESGKTYVYIAIRRPDGLVGKPVEAGTEVFAMDTGAGTNIIPNFDSGFPVDLSLIRNPTSASSWWVGTRLTAGIEVKVNGTETPVNWQYGVYDSNVGWQDYSGHGSSEMSWMWKRHAGFDVVTYKGDGSTFRNFGHSLGRTPEMMWVRGIGPNVANWYVYHKDLDNANRRDLKLENIDGQSSESTGRWNDTFPTATAFTVGVNANNNGDSYVTMLFASVDGISKVGSYTGNGSASGPTIDLGFAPRFILIKCKTSSTNWFVYDTLRGLSSGNDQRLQLNNNGNQVAADDIDPTATGFQVVSTWDQLNGNNTSYVYYAHA